VGGVTGTLLEGVKALDHAIFGDGMTPEPATSGEGVNLIGVPHFPEP
jgi:hypothetical protein